MKSSDAKYGGRSANPLAALEKRQYVTSKALVRGLKESLDAIKGKIATAKTPAFAESQRKLFAEISAAYSEIAKTTDKYLKAEVSAAAALGGKAAGNDADGHDLVRWDEARCRRYWMYVNPQAGKKLAAVFTDKMAESTVIALRRSVVEVQRRAAIEGMSLKDQHKAILESWNALTGDDSNFQFVDKSGKAWDNARYLQMLSRTTVQRVYRDAYADRLAESGYKLVRITSLGAPDCPVCRAWQGVICTIAGTQGNLPTIDQAREAGVWHPNCVCSMEYVDEELDADDIEAQEKTAAVDWEDGDAVQERTDGMAIGKYKAQGMDDAEAEDALTRAKIEEALRTELFLENSGDIANGFSHGQLEGFRKKGIPDFALTKGKQKPGIDGGTIYIDRAHPEESLRELLRVGHALRGKGADDAGEPPHAAVERLVERLKGAGREVPPTIAGIGERMDAAQGHTKKVVDAALGNGAFERIDRNFAATMREAFDKGSFAMKISDSSLAKVLKPKNGHFKSCFELKGYSPELLERRREVSESAMGAAGSCPATMREKYGYLASADVKLDFDGKGMGAGNYGNVVVRFKKDMVMPTFTIGDSLASRDFGGGTAQAASLVSDPRFFAYMEGSVPDRLNKTVAAKLLEGKMPVGRPDELQHQFARDSFGKSYTELQYHGWLGKDAIESVSFPDMQALNAIGGKAKEQLRELGAKVYVGGEPYSL